MFNTPSAYTKKRKRMVGTNPKSQVEIKQWNPRYAEQDTSYEAVNLYNVLNTSMYQPLDAAGSWYPCEVYWPKQGTASNQRIGNTFFLKYLRFKGYIRVYRNLPIGLRWRIRLLRCQSFKFTDVNSTALAQTRIEQYLNMFHNGVTPAQWGYPQNLIDCTRHNFHKMVKKVETSNVLKSKIIASGYIPPNNDEVGNVTIGTIGNSNVNTVGKAKIYRDPNGFYNVPVDVKVTCNDVIKIQEIYYYYVLEVDNGVGCNFDYAAAGYTLTNAKADAGAEFNFFIRGYFKDQ